MENIMKTFLGAMAAGGMRFDATFATPVCSPSRAVFLTGKYNHRIGIPDILGRNGSARQPAPGSPATWRTS